MKAKHTLWVIVVLLGVAGTGMYWLASVFYPPLLLFPHKRMVGVTPVYSASPIPDEIEGVIGRADALVRASPLFAPEVLSRPVYLTDGGLRWRLLSLNVSNSLALSRPAVETIVVNRSDVAMDRVWYSGNPVPARDLTSVIAHERTHVLIRQRFGLLSSQVYPTWVVEGYSDHVSGTGSVSDEAAARMIAEGRRTRGLFYYESRKRVTRELEANGGSVEALFQSSQRRRVDSEEPAA
jgi:hypothetical protein